VPIAYVSSVGLFRIVEDLVGGSAGSQKSGQGVGDFVLDRMVGRYPVVTHLTIQPPSSRQPFLECPTNSPVAGVTSSAAAPQPGVPFGGGLPTVGLGRVFRIPPGRRRPTGVEQMPAPAGGTYPKDTT
jgi:hypothetical protein